MLNNLESTIQSVITRATQSMGREIAQAVRAALAAEFAGIAPSAGDSQAARRPGRPKKTAAAAPKAEPSKPAQAAKAAKPGKPAQVAKPAKPANAKLQRRTSQQVDADDAKILAHVKAHPGLRSIDMKKAIGLPKQNLSSGLDRLRDTGKVRMTGNRSAATYSAA